MDRVDLDEVDRGILHLLQQDARHNSATAIAEEVGVTGTTVGNRIDRLESTGVVRGYHPDIDYERAGFPLHVLFVCNADPRERTEVARRALSVHGVVSVRETIAGHRNVHVEVVARDTDDVEAAADALHDMGLETLSSDVMKEQLVQPWNHFYVEESDAGADVDRERGG